ncbi:hypothetical protein HYALB_00010617 [Hymenoscyphus albidus]|uniref:2EXR domain-containing protein n=1 Tax=Hymenoscyphus albidus TaxID=595503 RepID=A0A9N9LPW3_9HELO|nr:hypothetical protein HYALB_00010617 [Hymenoscyphus albidus]
MPTLEKNFTKLIQDIFANGVLVPIPNPSPIHTSKSQKMAATTFPRFRFLPLEMREQVWKEALPAPRVICFRLVNTIMSDEDGGEHRVAALEKTTRDDGMATACKESRQIWEKEKNLVLDQAAIGYPKVYRYNSEDRFLLYVDELVFTPTGTVGNGPFYPQALFSKMGPFFRSLLSGIRHIAIDPSIKKYRFEKMVFLTGFIDLRLCDQIRNPLPQIERTRLLNSPRGVQFEESDATRGPLVSMIVPISSFSGRRYIGHDRTIIQAVL